MSALTSVIRMLVVLAGVVLAPAAFAQSLTVTAPPTIDPDNAAVRSIALNYSLPPGTYPSVVIELPWPDPVPAAGSVTPIFVTSAYAATFTFSSGTSGGHSFYRWTATNLVVEGTSTSGAISVSLKLLRFGALNGATYTWAPTMRGSVSFDATPADTVAVPEAKLKYHDSRVSSTNWIQGNNGLGIGLLVRYDFRIENFGNARIAGGAQLDVTLGRNSYFVRAFATDDNSGVPPPTPSSTLSFESVPTPWTRPASGEPDQIVSAIAIDQIGDSVGQLVGDFYDASPHLHIDVFIPCEYVGPQMSLTDPLFSATAVSVGPELLASGQIVERVAGQGQNLTSPAVVNVPLAAIGYECGEGGGLSKNWKGEIRGTDINIEWQIFVDPPKAIFLEKAMIVDRLPPGLSGVTATLDPQHTATLGDRPGFMTYYCNFDATALGQLTVDTFLQLATTRCTTSAWDPTRNHLVFWAPEGWGSEAFGIQPTDFRVFTYVPANWLINGNTSPMRNFAWFEGSADGDYYGGPGPVAVRQWYDEGYRNISDRSLPSVEDYNAAVDFDPNTGGVQQPPRTVARGSSSAAAFRIFSPTHRAPAYNPTLAVTPPPGVVVTGVRIVYQTSVYPQCDQGMDAATTPPQVPLTTPLTWQFGDDVTPYRLRYYCAYGIVDFMLPTNYPYVNGQSLTFHGVASAENMEQPGTADVVFTALVPPEMRVNVDGSCWDDGEPGEPGFRVTSLNTGGVDLTGISTTFDVPANATYAGIDPVTDHVPPGAVFKISADGTNWTVTSPGDGPNASIRYVRLSNFGIVAGVAADAVRFKVRLALTSGTSVVGAAVMDSNELPPTSPTSSLLANNACPSDVTMYKFFDGDRDGGLAKSGEVFLGGWGFTLQNGATTLTQVTANGSGVAEFLELPVGTWTFSETQPGGLPTGSTWTQTTNVTSVVVPGNGAPVMVFVGNACTCNADIDGNSCTFPGCDATGACTTPEEPIADGQPCGEDACSESECDNGECVAIDEVDCTDNNSCTTDSCDSEEGCINALPTCEVVDFYATVSDGTRTGQVHCTVAAGEAPLCDTESDQRTLRIAWNAPSMCGGWTPVSE